MVPGQENLALDAALLAVNSEAFFEIAMHGDGQFKVSQGSIGKIGFDKPAISGQALGASSADSYDITREVTGSIHEVTTVGQHEIAALVRLWIAGGPQGFG